MYVAQGLCLPAIPPAFPVLGANVALLTFVLVPIDFDRHVNGQATPQRLPRPESHGLPCSIAAGQRAAIVDGTREQSTRQGVVFILVAVYGGSSKLIIL